GEKIEVLPAFHFSQLALGNVNNGADHAGWSPLFIVLNYIPTRFHPADRTVFCDHTVFDYRCISFPLEILFDYLKNALLVIRIDDFFQESGIENSVVRRIADHFAITRTEVGAVSFQVPIPETFSGKVQN